MGNKPKPPPGSSLPQNWPLNLPYLASPLYSPHLTRSHFLALRTPPSPSESVSLPRIPTNLRPGPTPAVQILPITNPAHPAYGQHGLFAARDLRPGEFILPYLGEVHVGSGEGAEEHEESDYDLWIDREEDLAVDAAGAGNEGRFVNDYRGVPASFSRCLPPCSRVGSGRGDGDGRGEGKGKWNEQGKWVGQRKERETKKRPNAEFKTVWDERRKERGMAVFVLPAGKRATPREREVGIRKGEEILVSYGKGFWGGRRGEEEERGEKEGNNEVSV